VRARSGKLPVAFWFRIRPYSDAVRGLIRSSPAAPASDRVVFHRAAAVWTGFCQRRLRLSSRRCAVLCRPFHRLRAAGGSPIGRHGRKGGCGSTACGGIFARLPREPAPAVSSCGRVAQGAGRRMGGKTLAARSRSATLCSHAAEMKKAGEYSEEDTHRPACHGL
jgi:hypothetical protein